MSPLSPGLLHVGVSEFLELIDQAIAMVALDLDDAVLDRAAGAAFLLERAAQRLELRPGQRHSMNGAHALATPMRGFLPDADGRRLARCCGFHVLLFEQHPAFHALGDEGLQLDGALPVAAHLIGRAAMIIDAAHLARQHLLLGLELLDLPRQRVELALLLVAQLALRRRGRLGDGLR